MNTNDIPQAHPELLDALHRQDEQARQMKLSEGFTEKVMKKTHSGLVFYRKIAAIFLAAAFLGGLAWAIIPHFLSSKIETSQSAQVTAPSLTGMAGGESSIRFSDIRLDSILTVVATHYGKTVCFRDDESRAMKLITTWNPADSLATFIDHLNMFDYLRLTLQDDTIFVEQTSEED